MSDDEDERVETQARRLRELLDVDYLVPMDMIRVLDQMKRGGFIKDFREVSAVELGGAEGQFNPTTRIMLFTSGTLAGAARGDQRSNFTIAHELGHWADGVAETRNRGGFSGKRTARDERFANRFAAAFLAPRHKAAFTLKSTPDDLSQRFNISAPAAKHRHEQLAREYRQRNRIARPAPRVVVDFHEELRKRRGLPTVQRVVRGNTYTRPSTPQRRAQALAPAPLPYDDRPCPCCGNKTLLSIGVKFLCDTPDCGYVTDLPDGD